MFPLYLRESAVDWYGVLEDGVKSQFIGGVDQQSVATVGDG